MAEKNYYIILEVKSTATFDEIKSAYRVLAKKYHPDKNIGNKAAEEYFKEIQQAYGILSNPEKRKKYDLKQSFGSRPHSQKANASGPQYSGNAYQFAQQQAAYKQKAHTQSQKKQSEKTEAKDTWQILVSVGIALVLLYFIISYSTEKTTTVSNLKTAPAIEKIEEPEVQTSINNYDSPYSVFFGEEVYDVESKNSISFLNGSKSEAVVFLVEKNTPNKTIRNVYMNSETQIKMNQIPDGEYFLKIYFGKDWNAGKTFSNEKIKGGFESENVFLQLNDGADALVMKKEKKGAIDSYSTYELKISPDDKQNAKTISSEAFFKN